MAHQFLDTAQILVTAGRGGHGCRSFHHAPGERHRRADGGNGGDGGDVILRADPQVITLLDCAYRKQYRAGAGGHGGSNARQGARGKHCVVPVPPGTLVRDAASNALLRDLAQPDERAIVATGGRGGRGNLTTREVTRGEPGEERLLDLELKLIADVGLVGLPNAGKSSLLRRISHATPRVASFPFTTKSPVLGVVEVPDGDTNFTACDIPGLIAGAHLGKGLGLAFLRHVERTRLLLYVLDMAGSEGRHPWEDFQTLQAELAAYHPSLGDKPRVIAANKMDLPTAQRYLQEFQQSLQEDIHPISCLTGDGMDALRHGVWRTLQALALTGQAIP